MVDAKIDQDLKILQQLISKPPSGGAVVNVINIGRIQVGSIQEPPKEELSYDKGEGQLVERQLKDKSTYHPLLPKLEHCGKFDIDEKFYHNLQYVMENLPEPRYESLIRMMFEVTKEKFEKASDAAEWIGMNTDMFYKHMRKYGMSKFRQTKEIERDRKPTNIDEAKTDD